MNHAKLDERRGVLESSLQSDEATHNPHATPRLDWCVQRLDVEEIAAPGVQVLEEPIANPIKARHEVSQARIAAQQEVHSDLRSVQPPRRAIDSSITRPASLQHLHRINPAHEHPQMHPDVQKTTKPARPTRAASSATARSEHHPLPSGDGAERPSEPCLANTPSPGRAPTPERSRSHLRVPDPGQ